MAKRKKLPAKPLEDSVLARQRRYNERWAALEQTLALLSFDQRNSLCSQIRMLREEPMLGISKLSRAERLVSLAIKRLR